MRLAFPIVLFLFFSASYSAAAEPQWIWSTKDAATKAEQGSAYFRKVFSLDEPEAGSAEITADNAFELFLNGRRVGTGDSWNKRYKFNLTPLLLPGPNVLAIAANNGGPDPAGVAAKFTLKSKGKNSVEIITDNTWKFHLKPQGTWARIESDDSTWPAAFALGEYGQTAPWGKAGELVEGGTETAILNKPRSREKGLFEFRDGDRVVFLGSGFIERLQNTGYLETMLTAAMPTKNITFRNLGWSGDTVWGDARAVFGSRADGFKRLLSDVALCEPTVLIVCYGENEAYAGEAGLEEFRSGLNTLLDSLEATGARIVLLGPRQHEKLPPPLPDPAKYNADLRKYNDVTSQVTKEREHTFLDLYDALIPPRGRNPTDDSLTDNGLWLSSNGDYQISRLISARFGVQLERRISINASSLEYTTTNLMVRATGQSDKGIWFEVEDRSLAWAVTEDMASGVGPAIRSFLAFSDFVCGITANDVVIGEFSGPYVEGLDIFRNPKLRGNDSVVGKQLAQLNRAINEKNTLFFHRYRPQNETYLFLFRKHEQGNNAVEIPQFDPLIAELEKKIAELKKPVKQKYELIKVK